MKNLRSDGIRTGLHSDFGERGKAFLKFLQKLLQMRKGENGGRPPADIKGLEAGEIFPLHQSFLFPKQRPEISGGPFRLQGNRETAVMAAFRTKRNLDIQCPYFLESGKSIVHGISVPEINKLRRRERTENKSAEKGFLLIFKFFYFNIIFIKHHVMDKVLNAPFIWRRTPVCFFLSGWLAFVRTTPLDFPYSFRTEV